MVNYSTNVDIDGIVDHHCLFVCFVDIDGIVDHHCLFVCFVDIDGIVDHRCLFVSISTKQTNKQ
jgi:hypothetical protein